MPLADAGFEVIAPDLRGHGESSLAPDGFYDIAAFSKDLYTLVHDVLGHEHCFVAGGDVGGPVIYDLSLRYPGFVRKLCFFNTVPPILDGEYEAAGIPPDAAAGAAVHRGLLHPPGHRSRRPARGARHAGTPPRVRRRHVRPPALGRAAARSRRAEVDFMTEPYADADKLRASWGVYESSTGNRPMSDIAAVPGAEPDADARALRARGPRGAPLVPRPVQGRVHRVHRPARGGRAPATSCSGRPPTSSTACSRTSSSRRDRRAAFTAPAPSIARGDAEHDRLAERGRQHLHADGRPAAPVPNGTLIAGVARRGSWGSCRRR